MSQQRRGFVLDRQSMGISSARPTSPSPSSASTPNCLPKADQDSPQQKQQQQVSKDASKQDMLAREGTAVAPPHAQCNASTEILCTDYYRNLLQKLRDTAGDASQVNFELNNIFVKRLGEIDCLDGQGGDAMMSSQLRLVTFQEWVDFLLHVNSVILGNMSALEEEAYGKIVTCFQSVQGEQQQALDENRKLRKDICAIIKMVQSAYHHNIWDTKGICLETLTINQLLGVAKDQALPESESEKMAECMNALVTEMATKHDEICHLKSQLCALDEVVQTARQKLLLKDQCISQLNQQLQEATRCIVSMTEETPCEADSLGVGKDMDSDQEFSTLCGPKSQDMLKCLTLKDRQESEFLRSLNTELDELFELHTKQEYQAMDDRRKQLSCFMEKLNSEREETVRKLESIRSHLRLLQSDIDQSSKDNGGMQLDESDLQLLEALRKRIQALSTCNRELHGRCQHLDTESKIKISELQVKFDWETVENERNSQILKELAELICKLGCAEFSYNEIYNETFTENPFCLAITAMFEEKSAQEVEQMTCNKEASADCPHRKQLEHTLLHCQTQSEILQATRDNYLSIIDEFKRDLEELTEQVELQQQNQHNGISCPEPELHSQSPPRINCELEIQNERLACQVQGFQDTLKDRDDQIVQLQTMINSYSDFSKNNRLKDEIHELKQNNSDLSRKVRELTSLLNSQQEQSVELVTKYETLMASFEEQCQELKEAKRRVQSLQNRLGQVEKLQEELRTERKMLREEVIALKEKDATWTGRERALQDQLRISHQELEKTRSLIRDMQGHLQQEDTQHREAVRQLEQTNESLREQIRGFGAECQQMQLQLKQQADVNRQQEQIIESFRKWKDAQVRADEAMRQCVKRAEEHINMLLEENQTLAEDYRLLFRDHTLLEAEMYRVKQAVNQASTSSLGCPPQAPSGRRDPEAGNDMARRLQSINSTSRRIFNQFRTLNANANAVPLYSQEALMPRMSAGGSPDEIPTSVILRPTRSSSDVLD
ncbi:hypothetical protein KR009_008933 [Drosophila setifemur]|nr:hypothetical protein KR009_008933 [Drosophila setifemur]